MGDATLIASGKYQTWTGGKPKADWTGLDPSASTVIESPNQVRDTTVKGTNAYNLRRTGLTYKFKKGGDLVSFIDKITQHFEDHGMDSILYRSDPSEPTKMLSVVEDYPLFNLEDCRANSKILSSKFDAYDKSNDKCAKAFLLDSIEYKYADKINRKKRPGDTFADFWMIFISMETSISAKRFKNVEDKIKAMKITSYEGQNVEQFCADLRREVQILVKANMYDSNLTMTMLENLIEAGGDNNRSYKAKLEEKLFLLEEKLPKVSTLPRVEAEEKTAGGIVLPDSARERPQQGRILSVGDGRWLADGGRATPQVSEGDRVLFSSYAGSEVLVDGDELLIMSEEDILAIFE